MPMAEASAAKSRAVSSNESPRVKAGGIGWIARPRKPSSAGFARGGRQSTEERSRREKEERLLCCESQEMLHDPISRPHLARGSGHVASVAPGWERGQILNSRTDPHPCLIPHHPFTQ